jgi:hypothetical protein
MARRCKGPLRETDVKDAYPYYESRDTTPYEHGYTVLGDQLGNKGHGVHKTHLKPSVTMPVRRR